MQYFHEYPNADQYFICKNNNKNHPQTEFSYLNVNHAHPSPLHPSKIKSMGWNRPTAHGSTPNSIQIDLKKCEEMSTEVSALSYHCKLELKSRSFKLVSYNLVSFKRNRAANVQMQNNVKTK